MKINHVANFINGWIIGNFEPSLLKQEGFEIAIHEHAAGESSDGHYHAIATEINVVLSGSVKIDYALTLEAGSIWTTLPYENPLVQFLETTKLLVIKTPSVPGDKYYINKELPLYPEQLRELRAWTPTEQQAIELFKNYPVELTEEIKCCPQESEPFLGVEKYQPTKDAIMAGLGIPAELWEKSNEIKCCDAGSSDQVDK